MLGFRKLGHVLQCSYAGEIVVNRLIIKNGDNERVKKLHVADIFCCGIIVLHIIVTFFHRDLQYSNISI